MPFRSNIHCNLIWNCCELIIKHLSLNLFPRYINSCDSLAIVSWYIRLSLKLWIFPYLSTQGFVLVTQKNRLNETVLLSTHNICFG